MDADAPSPQLAEGGVEEMLDDLLHVPVLVQREDGEREVRSGDDGPAPAPIPPAVFPKLAAVSRGR